MPEIIEHGENGFLVSEYHDAIEHLDRIKTINRVDCRQTVVDRFTVDRMVEQYCEVYNLITEKVI
jgi:glycosyltransferase involved in cell wall biosynthesis